MRSSHPTMVSPGLLQPLGQPERHGGCSRGRPAQDSVIADAALEEL